MVVAGASESTILMLWPELGLWMRRSAGLAVNIATRGGIGVDGSRVVVGGEGFVGKVGVGIFANYVPGVDESWEEAQTTKC